jgi:glycosyltransferase involved in cell wall biosynthesis
VLAASPAQLLQQEPPLTPADLRAELAGQPLQALAEERPSPPAETLFSWQLPEASGAAVVVSLFNYADRITAALNSAASQRQRQLELIVVDDASTDGGTAVVEAWMQALLAAGDHPFVRLQLLRHSRNAGLAAARNTAFAAAQAPWCLVLDADNALYPDAVAACLALAEGGIDRLAVVHPLLAVEAEPGRPDEQRSLVSTAAWQQQRLLRENTVDAMALVRRSAWQAVGGYTHIEGGWEDYDFWCKLIAAGYHGVQCPRLLAVYRSHGGSMSQTVTNRSWRALSRTLQQRHPWLELPLAR